MQVVAEQYKKKMKKCPDYSSPFTFNKEDVLAIPTDFSAINGWSVDLLGKTEVYT